LKPSSVFVPPSPFSDFSRTHSLAHITVALFGGLSPHTRICTKLCTGKLGIAMKVAGGIVLFWVIFIIGYVTGYYIHKCK
uniref:Uncharacterized protein n=1 Tax=Vombatus ursinus TaxID=29139 RepID=A0A4X2M6G1_VOMUR